MAEVPIWSAVRPAADASGFGTPVEYKLPPKKNSFIVTLSFTLAPPGQHDAAGDEQQKHQGR